MEIAVAGMEHIDDAQPVFLRQLGHVPKNVGELRARDGGIETIIIGRDAAERGKGGLAPGPEQHRSASLLEMRTLTEPHCLAICSTRSIR